VTGALIGLDPGARRRAQPAELPWRAGCLALAGDPAARLLAGPPAEAGEESLIDHLHRLGPLDPGPATPGGSARLRELVRSSGLLGRGGGEFPVARKLDTAAAAPGTPIVVVNGSEGEPASRKDRTLLELRPQLVLDGAAVAAAATGADEIVVYLHAERLRSWHTVRHALAARRRAGLAEPPVRVVAALGRYVAGESSAVVSAVEGGNALPRRRTQPVAASGVHGRPTVVSNVESVAHLALLARFGPAWFREAGTPASPGSTLVTLGGGVAVPGLVAEVLAPVSGGELLLALGGLDDVPPAVLVGGYAGTWLPGESFCASALDRATLGAAGAGLGCGLIAPLPRGACGLRVTLRLLEYLAGESAGQCGPCVYGLPALAVELERIAAGRASRRDAKRLFRQAVSVAGKGACGHPDGAVRLLESALDVFAADVTAHVRGRPCAGAELGWFPVDGVGGIR
jgi:NADH:ubiquinone oxidoreductase subunit F (NADH-binding)